MASLDIFLCDRKGHVNNYKKNWFPSEWIVSKYGGRALESPYKKVLNACFSIEVCHSKFKLATESAHAPCVFTMT